MEWLVSRLQESSFRTVYVLAFWAMLEFMILNYSFFLSSFDNYLNDSSTIVY